MKLSREIVALYNNQEAAILAEEYFKSLFQKNEIPEDIPSLEIMANENIVDVITKAKLVSSKSEARRLVQQGGVKVNRKKVIDFNDQILKNGDIIQVGKRKFVKVNIIQFRR